MQVEACPFHSSSLPQKNAYLQKIAKDELLVPYAGHLRAFLKDRPVVSPQAVATRFSLARDSKILSVADQDSGDRRT